MNELQNREDIQHNMAAFSQPIKSALIPKGLKIAARVGNAFGRALVKALGKFILSFFAWVGIPTLVLVFFGALLNASVFAYWGGNQNFIGDPMKDNIINWNVNPVFVSWNPDHPENKEINDRYQQYADESVVIKDYYQQEENYKVSKGLLISLDRLFYDMKEDHAKDHIAVLKPKFIYRPSAIKTETNIKTYEKVGNKWELVDDKTDTDEKNVQLLTAAETFAGTFTHAYKQTKTVNTHTETKDNIKIVETETVIQETLDGINYLSNGIKPLKDYIVELDSKHNIMNTDADYPIVIGLANAIDTFNIEPETDIIASLGVNFITGEKVFVGSPFLSDYSTAYRPFTGLQPDHPLYNIIVNVAQKYMIDPNLIYAIILTESSGRVDATSGAGAIGLMQLMPETAAMYGYTPEDMRVPWKNIDAGTRYIKTLIEKYHGNIAIALAAYNAGPGRLDQWIEKAGTTDWNALKSMDFAFTETAAYPDKVFRYWNPASAVATTSDQQLKVLPLNSEGLVVTSEFGYRIHPILKQKKLHEGIDLACKNFFGSPVYAAGNGKVVFAGVQSGYGNVVKIDHGNGLVTVYAHLRSYSVLAGQTVVAGQEIGRGGNSGLSSGPHLHFGTYLNGQPVSPMNFYPVGTFVRG